jgi:hypothetical protein
LGLDWQDRRATAYPLVAPIYAAAKLTVGEATDFNAYDALTGRTPHGDTAN